MSEINAHTHTYGRFKVAILPNLHVFGLWEENTQSPRWQIQTGNLLCAPEYKLDKKCLKKESSGTVLFFVPCAGSR